jgi:acetyl-CoA carboxylase carboxyl transferase subunit alpha
LGGAHRDVDVMAENIKRSLIKTLDSLRSKSTDELVEARYKRLMSYGQFTDR